MLIATCFALAWLLAAPKPALGHSFTVAAGPAASPTAGISAVIGGSRWPGRGVARIRYFNASSAKWPVAQAVKAWNTSGARVRFVPVPRRRAQVVITNSRGPASDTALWGFASVGYIYPGGGFVHLSPLAHPRRPHYSMAGVATHELGHVLGLNHEDRRCATMNTALWASCGNRPCRLLERDDIRGAIQLYGGRAKLVRPSFCPAPPSSIRATPAPNRYEVALEWRTPRGPFVDRVEGARGRGKWPPRRSARPEAGTNGRFVDRDFASGTRLATGRYCYALWSVGNPNMVSRRRTVWVDFNPTRPSAPAGLEAALGQDGLMTLSWTVTQHPELEAVEGTGARGACPDSPAAGEYGFAAEKGTTSTVALPTPGRYCFVAWARDSLGALIGPSEPVWVDHRGTAPVASFSPSTYSLTAEFYDQSYDEDGDEIVARRWEFGDGTVLEGNEQAPSHTYATAGTYTVRLTVADANGLTGTTTDTVSVSPDY